MEQVVGPRDGEEAQIPGYSIAGKTGTASKLINGHYSHSENNASFVGFLPSRRPALAMIVVIDSPHGEHGRTADRSRRRSGSGSRSRRCSISASARMSMRRRRCWSRAAMNRCRRRWTATCRGRPTRPPETATRRAPTVSLVADGPPGTVPDLRGLSARDAIRRLVKLGLNARVSGDGFVVSQDPAAGEPLEPGRCAASCSIERASSSSDDLGRSASDSSRTRRGHAGDPVRAEASVGVVTGIAYDSRAVERGHVFVALKGLQRGRDRVRTPGDRPRRARDRVGGAGAARRPRALGHGGRRTAGARRARGGVPRRSEPRHAGRRHHRHERQDDDRVSARVDLRGGRHPLRHSRHRRLPSRARRPDVREAARTTPEAPDVQKLLREMVDRGLGACAMEVSSHALALRRVDDMKFAGGGVHQPDARSPRLPHRHGGVTQAKRAPVRDAADQRAGAVERRRSARRRAASTQAGGR